MDSDESLFFSRAARGLLGKDAGFALHLATGFEERTCYRYASGERMPPAYMLRVLLHSQAGEAWLNAIMHGCTAPWWLAHQQDKSDAAQLRAFDRARQLGGNHGDQRPHQGNRQSR